MSRSRRFPISILAAAIALVVSAPVPTRALHAPGQLAPGPVQTTGGGVSFSLGAGVGMAEGTATELAIYYPYGRKTKLSELTWDIKDVVMAGVSGSVGLGRRFRFNLGVWSALTEGGGMMVDRDWNYPDIVSAYMESTDVNWTDESRHPDTSLDEGLVVDSNLSVLALQAGAFSLHGIVGYKHESWRWSSRGGTYVYSTQSYGSRDAVGGFPAGEKVIDYEQRYSIPYLGIGARFTRSAFQVESHLLYSRAVFAGDTDYHVLRNVTFEGEFSGGEYVGLGLNGVWAFTPRWSVALGAEYQVIPEIVGDVTITGEEGSGRAPDGGGLAMNTLLVTLGAGYRF